MSHTGHVPRAVLSVLHSFEGVKHLTEHADMCCSPTCRPVGQMISPYLTYSGDQGLVTSEQDVVLLLVFSEPVNGLTASSFSISGPSGASVSGLKLLRGTNTYYHFTVNLPGTYYDAVTVNLQVSLHWHACACSVALPASAALEPMWPASICRAGVNIGMHSSAARLSLRYQ